MYVYAKVCVCVCECVCEGGGGGERERETPPIFLSVSLIATGLHPPIYASGLCALLNFAGFCFGLSLR